MNHQNLTCSRELAKRMAELGICQDGAELWWCKDHRNEFLILDSEPYHSVTGLVSLHIAPTLSRMMEELPTNCYISRLGSWHIKCENIVTGEEVFYIIEENLPNAVAKALIKLKEDGE